MSPRRGTAYWQPVARAYRDLSCIRSFVQRYRHRRRKFHRLVRAEIARDNL